MPRLTVASEASHPVELHFEDYGTGSPVVLIHGWPLSARSWEAQISPLVAAGHRVIAYDRRGFGESSQPWSGYDYDTFAADLHSLMTQLDLSDAALVGFSMGGGEVARYIGRYGAARVNRAVLASSVTRCLYRSDSNPEGDRDDATIASAQGSVTADRLAFLEGFATKFFSAGGTLRVSEAQRAYTVRTAAAASPKGTLDCIAAFGRADFRADLATFRLPTLVLHGDSDAIVPVEISGARAHRLIAGSTLTLVPGAPHGFNVSHAAEFNAALLGFLQR